MYTTLCVTQASYMAACPDIKVSQHTWPCTKSWTQMQLQMCHTHTHHNSLSSAPVTCLLMSGYLSCAYTTLVGLHVTKHRCHPSAALHTLPGMRCITQPTACMEGAACCEQLASLRKGCCEHCTCAFVACCLWHCSLWHCSACLVLSWMGT